VLSYSFPSLPRLASFTTVFSSLGCDSGVAPSQQSNLPTLPLLDLVDAVRVWRGTFYVFNNIAVSEGVFRPAVQNHNLGVEGCPLPSGPLESNAFAVRH